ncbi:MAG: EMC6-like membrane protein [Halobacteriota archaeon]
MAKTKGKPAPKTQKKGASPKAEQKGLVKADDKKEPGRQVKHVEGIKKTVLSSLLGIVGGVASFYLSAYSLFILIVIIYSQRLILPRVGVDAKEFRATDWFFLVFMTVAFWFVTWTILLNPA